MRSRSYSYYIILVILCFTLSGCFIPFPKSRMKLEDLPKASGESAKVIIAVDKNHKIPKLYLQLGLGHIARLRAGNYTEFYVKPGKYWLRVSWYYYHREEAMAGGGSMIPFIPLVEKNIGYGAWLRLQDVREQKILLKFEGKRSNIDSLIFGFVDSWPDNFSIDEYTFISPGIP